MTLPRRDRAASGEFPQEDVPVTTLSIVVPALNEEAGIASIIERVLATRPALCRVGISDTELIVVDDGSRDATARIASGYSTVRLIRHLHNLGYGAALKTGFCAAAGDLVGFLDADGTYPPEAFPALCSEALRGADLVVGSRRSGSKSEMPIIRQVGNLLWSGLVSLLGNHRVLDPASGMRVFRKAVF
jgi:glycosyltransferase involved in cell wall biosynthesis